MMEYFTYKKAKKHINTAEKSEDPVLNDEDEAFLQRVATEGTPPPLPDRPSSLPQDLPLAGSTRGNDAQIALMNGAQNVALPDVPDTPEGVLVAIEGEDMGKGKEKASDGKKKMWSFIRRDSRDSRRLATATDLDSLAQGLKAADARPNEDGQVSESEAEKEEEEMTSVLEQLNLAAVNNRVFSISKESQELLRKFTLVLKDLVAGVPTAYDDLESLLTNSEHQIQAAYKHLPSFLQKLIESLPSKLTAGTLGPEILAVAAERQGLKSEYLTQATGLASKMGMKVRVPNLKDLVTKPGAIATLLRTIMNFLKARFPAFLGMNVLWSLALFVLLFVFWYCHKRGRETRLAKERRLTEAELAQLEQKIASEPPYDPAEHLTTTAPEGAPIEEVEAGMYLDKVVQGTGEGEGEAKYAPEGALARDMEARKGDGEGKV